MRRSFVSSARPVAGAVALLLAITWAVPPAGAAEVKAPATKAPLSASVAATVAAKPMPRAMQSPTPAATSTDKGSFRSRTVIIAAVAMAAGLGFAIHSAFKDNDAVHSPIR